MKLKFTILGDPRTKKNSNRIVKIKLKNGGYIPKVLPSKAFEKYQESWISQLPDVPKPINIPANVKCLYYMKTRRKVDLIGLLQASCDIMVHFGILEDDNSKIVCSTDGSRVLYDKENPRVEIEITEIKKEIKNDL